MGIMKDVLIHNSGKKVLDYIFMRIFFIFTAVKIKVVIFWVVMRVVTWFDTDVSEGHAAAIFRVKLMTRVFVITVLLT
jgi:hypothetical protein